MRTALILLFLAPVAAFPMAHVTGNGGDQFAISFVQTGHAVADWLRSFAEPRQLPVTCESFLRTVKRTHVESTDEVLTADGAVKDALNFPALARIVLNRGAWERACTASARHALVFHEYLGIMGVDDSDYQISNCILVAPSSDRSFSKCSELPLSQQAVFSYLNAYLETGDASFAVLYIGAVAQYRADIEEFGDQADPNYGNRYTVALFESTPSYLCTDSLKIEALAKSGDPAAIELVLMYSAVSRGDDGVSAEILGELQDYLRARYPSRVRGILRKNAAFFKKYPMVWVSEF